MATCSTMEGTIRPLKSPKIVFSIYTEKHCKTWEKSANSLFIGLQIFINQQYISIGSTFISWSHLHHWSKWYLSRAEIHFGRQRRTEITHPKRQFSHATCRSVDGIGWSPIKTTYRLRPTRHPTCFVVSLCLLKILQNGSYQTWNNIQLH